jgi:hypothetical protein
MRHGVDYEKHRPVGNPKRKVSWVQQQGFPSVRNKRYINPKGKKPNDWRWCLLACDSSGQFIRRLVQCFALPATTQNLHTTQPNTLLPTYDEVVNLTGLLYTKEWAYRVENSNSMWYVSNVSIIFYAPCLFLHHLFSVSLHFVAFLCISGTNLLTRCHSASSLISTVFVF